MRMNVLRYSIRIIVNMINFYYAIIYHPPKTKFYEEKELIDYLGKNVHRIEDVDRDAVVFLAGDFNQLSNKLIEDCGLLNIIDKPTHLGHYLDRIYCSQPVYYCFKVVQPTIKTKHSAVIVAAGNSHIRDLNKSRVVSQIRSHKPAKMANYLSNVKNFDWGDVMLCNDTEKAFDCFYSKAQCMLDRYFPISQITVTSRDPPYVTPLIKSLLRKRNRLMRSGQIDKAEAFTKQVSTLITRENSRRLCEGNNRHINKNMWSEVNKIISSSSRPTKETSLDLFELNNHYARVSTDAQYSVPSAKMTCCAAGEIQTFKEWHIFRMLEHIRNSAAGPDGLPAWFLRLSAPIFAEPLAWLFNLSISSGIVPRQWKNASITPVAKVSCPVESADYRPISVTSILSRCMEKELVTRFLYPTMNKDDLKSFLVDQYAFRPTGSTTAALTAILQAATEMLKTEPYVRLIALDFSKAFDTLRHTSLSAKLLEMKLPDHVYNWVISFLSDRSHCTKQGNRTSNSKTFNAGVVQGSALGPATYILCASGLQPSNHKNRMFKYADDTYLLIPASMTDSVPLELDNVTNWANNNNLKLNLAKSKEMIIRGNSRSTLAEPAPTPNIPRVNSMVILGITINTSLSMDEHFANLAASANSSLYALQTLKRMGLKSEAIWTVCRATMISRLVYGSPAWRGFATLPQLDRLEALIRRAKRRGVYPSNGSSLEGIMDDADAKLFSRALWNDRHVLHHLLPPKKVSGYSTRPKAHNRVLPIKNNLTSKNFLIRLLYKDTY